jgi:hypothetical protein
MKKYILSQLPMEYRALYVASMSKRLGEDLRYPLRSRVRGIKRDIGTSIDTLAVKAERYPHSGDWGKAKLVELAEQVYSNKAPEQIDLGKWVSVEIECILPSKDSESDLVKYIRANGYAKHTTIKNDGSIRVEDCECSNPCNDGCYCNEDNDGGEVGDCQNLSREDYCHCENAGNIGKEIVISFKIGEAKILTDICAKLASLGAKVNKSCGLHVHFDCRHLEARQVTTLGKRIALTVPALKQLLPKSRQSNSYCRDTINSHKRGSRYVFVNLHSYFKHKTLEIRGHSGTTDAEKILYWIELLQAIMGKRNTTVVNHAEDLLVHFKLSPKLETYVLNRFSKFNRTSLVEPSDDVSDDNQAQESLAVA